MFLSTMSIVIMIIGTILAVIYIILLFASKKYDYMIEPLEGNDYPLSAVYGIGFLILDIIKYDYKNKSERKRRQDITLLYGEKHAEYYLHVNAAQRISLFLTVLVFGLVLYGMINDAIILMVILMMAVTLYYYYSTLPETMLNKKKDEILNEFADVVSKLALLVNAGMIMREAWEKVAYTGDGELYSEMKKVCFDINNGTSEIDAYTEFGARCASPEIKKFTSTIIQGLVKGNRELVDMIKQQSKEIWEQKRHRVRQQGEKAASKLMIPMMIMFVGVLIMIVVPIFANLGT